MEINERKINKLNNILENPQTQQNRKEKIETKNRKTPIIWDFPKCERKHFNRINHPNQTKQNFESKLEKKREFKNETKSHVSNKNLKRIQILSNKNWKA